MLDDRLVARRRYARVFQRATHVNGVADLYRPQQLPFHAKESDRIQRIGLRKQASAEAKNQRSMRNTASELCRFCKFIVHMEGVEISSNPGELHHVRLGYGDRLEYDHFADIEVRATAPIASIHATTFCWEARTRRALKALQALIDNADTNVLPEFLGKVSYYPRNGGRQEDAGHLRWSEAHSSQQRSGHADIVDRNRGAAGQFDECTMDRLVELQLIAQQSVCGRDVP